MKILIKGIDPFLLRILIFMPFGKDARLACELLEPVVSQCHICKTEAELIEELNKGAGLVLSSEEALPAMHRGPLAQFLEKQPTWSDLPILILTQPGGQSPWISGAFERLGNLTLLERPVRINALISATRSALRARQRQYEIRLADQRKDEFLAMLAHELRNPMAPISAAAQMLGRAAHEPDKVKLGSEIIQRQIGHMTNLIDDLLDVARVTRGMIQLDTEALDVRELLAEAAEQVAPLAVARHQELSLQLPSDPLLVQGDRERLIQVLVNLLNNASKYTPEKGRLVATARAMADQVELVVSDNGIGMEADLVDHVFEIFAQAERTSDRSQGGLGLGLALVKNLTVAHGGTVKAASPGLNQGSTFTVQLPRLQGSLPVNAVHTPWQLPTFTTPLRIMLVDDNVDAADALAMLLTAVGHEVIVEHGAAAALYRARLSPPQVCLLDVGMPDIDGYQLARLLKASPETSSTLLIAVTGYGQANDREMAFAAGFNHHLVKPVDTCRLFELLAKVQ